MTGRFVQNEMILKCAIQPDISLSFIKPLYLLNFLEKNNVGTRFAKVFAAIHVFL
jgi:hypothetical protein